MEKSMLGGLGKRLVAYVVLIAAALLALKLVSSAVVGFVTTVATVLAIVAVAVAALWAYRRL